MGAVRHLPVTTPAADRVFGDVPPDAGDEGERLLQVGDIAKATGKTVRAIHHYEEVGLLRPHARSKGRYRLYDQQALARVRWIGKLHDLGLSLAQIQEMVHLWESAASAPGAMARIRGIYTLKLEETRAQVAHLAALERELAASIDYLDTCDTCDPAELVRACTCCSYHDKSKPEPHLVAGIHAGSSPSRVTMGPLPPIPRGGPETIPDEAWAGAEALDCPSEMES
jgi:MerR family transcriptional regulator, copper efflux regulator